MAGIAAAMVDPAGPLHGRRREVVCCSGVASTRARIIFEDVLAFLGGRYDLSDRSVWRKQDSANRATLEFRASGCRIRCIGSDPGRAHGLRPALALLDEPAQWEPGRADRMLAGDPYRVGEGSGESRLIALGTRPS